MEGHYGLVLTYAEVYKVRIEFSNRSYWPNLDHLAFVMHDPAYSVST